MSKFFSPVKDKRCPCCSAEWNGHSLKQAGIKGCPHCHTALEPLELLEDGYIYVNWQDIRVLVLYASRWAKLFDNRSKMARDAKRALDTIVKNLQQFRPASGRILVPEQDVIAIETYIKASTENQKVVEVTIKHLGAKENKITSPYFVNI